MTRQSEINYSAVRLGSLAGREGKGREGIQAFAAAVAVTLLGL